MMWIRPDPDPDHCYKVGLYRISGLPDIQPFLISGIRPDIRFHLPDIRPDYRISGRITGYPAGLPDIRPDIW